MSRNDDRPAFQFDERDYARPQQGWTCGWAAEGQACPLGPDHRGGCRADFECAPAQKGERWICTRPRTRGGPCENGPLPDGTCCRKLHRCQPKRTVRNLRGVVGLCVFAASLGACLLLTAGPWRDEAISPGPLSSPHSTVVHACEKCHLSGDGLTAWANGADPKNPHSQNQLCLDCHDQFGESAAQPHSVSKAQLKALTDKAHRARSGAEPALLWAARNLWGKPEDPHGEMTCAACHREHQGHDYNLAQMTDQQCQICHVQAFEDFKKGHPDFTQYPYKRRTRIYFDHQSHYGAHFPEDQQKLTCVSCHTSDPSGRAMLVIGYEKNCSQCHDWQIEEANPQGVVLAALPSVDLSTLQASQLEIGQWPKTYPLHVEAGGRFSPLVRLICGLYDEEFQRMQQRIEAAELDLRDLRGASPEQLQLVQSYLLRFKQIWRRVIDSGREELQRKLRTKFSRSTTEKMTQLVPWEMLQTAHDRWLNERLLQQPPSPTIAEDIANERSKEKRGDSGHYLRDSDLSIRYRPHGHADAVFKSLLELSLQHGGETLLAEKAAPEKNQKPWSELLQTLTQTYSVGRCVKCHSIDRQKDRPPQIHWEGVHPDPHRQGFTRFTHSPHLRLLDDDVCLRCHVMQEDDPQRGQDAWRPEYFRRDLTPRIDPHDFQSNFRTMKQEDCSHCHRPESARQSCMTCHNYHVSASLGFRGSGFGFQGQDH